MTEQEAMEKAAAVRREVFGDTSDAATYQHELDRAIAAALLSASRPAAGHVTTEDGVQHHKTEAFVDLHDVPDDGVTLRVRAIITDAAMEEALSARSAEEGKT